MKVTPIKRNAAVLLLLCLSARWAFAAGQGAVVQFTVASQSISEDRPTATVTVTRISAGVGAFTVEVLPSLSSAEPGIDFSGTQATPIVMSAVSTTISIRLLNNDFFFTEDRVITLGLTNAQAGTALGAIDKHEIRILDDGDRNIAFSQGVYNVTEGDITTVTLTRLSAAADFTAQVRYSYDVASAPSSNYMTLSAAEGVVSFPTCQPDSDCVWQHTLAIPTLDNGVYQPDLTLTLRLAILSFSAPNSRAVVLGRVSTTKVVMKDDLDAGTLSLVASQFRFSEALPSVPISITRTGKSGANVQVQIEFFSGPNDNATAAVDYDARSRTLTLLAGQVVLTTPLTIFNDGEYDPDETLTVRLSRVTGGAILAGAVQSLTRPITILDDGDATVAFTRGAVTHSEAVSTLTLTLTRYNNPALPVTTTIKYDVVGGAGTAVSDITCVTGATTCLTGTHADLIDPTGDPTAQTRIQPPVVIRPGESTTLVLITVCNDEAFELDETFVIELLEIDARTSVTGPPAVAVPRATVTITDDGDAGTLAFTSTSFSAVESTPQVTVTITRMNGGSCAVGAVFETLSGTATAGLDFTPVQSTVELGAGQVHATRTVPILNDALNESPNEFFFASLREPVGGVRVLGNHVQFPSLTTVTILDDGDVGLIEFTAPNVSTSILEDSHTLVFTVTRIGVGASGTLDDDVFGFATEDGSATGVASPPQAASMASDYLRVAEGVIAFAAGSRTATFTINVFDDIDYEGESETFQVKLTTTPAGYEVGHKGVSTVTIVEDDDNTITFTSPAVSVLENAGSVVVTVSRYGTAAVDVQFTFAHVGGTATAALDFNRPTTQGLRFAPSVLSTTVRIPLIDDDLFEFPDETIILQLSSPVNASLDGIVSHPLKTITLLDDRDAGTIEFASKDVMFEEGSMGNAVTLTVTRLGKQGGTQFVYVSLDPGAYKEAQPTLDYISANPIVVQVAGNTHQATLTIPIVDDDVLEGDERVRLFISRVDGGASIGNSRNATLTIQDNNDMRLVFGASLYEFVEAHANYSVPIMREGFLGSPVAFTITKSFAGSTMVERQPNSHVGKVAPLLGGRASELFAIPAGQTSTCIHIRVYDDADFQDPDEYVRFFLSDPYIPTEAKKVLRPGFLGTPRTTTVAIVDDGDAGAVRFLQTNISAFEHAGLVVFTVSRTGPPDLTASVDMSIDATLSTATPGVDTAPFAKRTLYFYQVDPSTKVTRTTAAVAIADDYLFEDPDEVLVVKLAEATGGVWIKQDALANLTIVDDGVDVSVKFTQASYSVFEDHPSNITITATRIGNAFQPVRFSMSTSSTTTAQERLMASMAPAGPILFEPGVRQLTFVVPFRDDTIYSADSVVAFNFGSLSSTALPIDVQPSLQVIDAFGNRVAAGVASGVSATVTLVQGANVGGILTGNLSAIANPHGVLEFNGLAQSSPSLVSPWQLNFAVLGLPSVQMLLSASFSMVAYHQLRLTLSLPTQPKLQYTVDDLLGPYTLDVVNYVGHRQDGVRQIRVSGVGLPNWQQQLGRWSSTTTPRSMGPLPATYQTSSLGRLAIARLGMRTPGQRWSLRFELVESGHFVDSPQLSVSNGAPARLIFAVAPRADRAWARLAQQPVVQVLDSFDNTVEDAAHLSVSIELFNSTFLLNGTLSTPVVRGFATFRNLYLLDASGPVVFVAWLSQSPGTRVQHAQSTPVAAALPSQSMLQRENSSCLLMCSATRGAFELVIIRNGTGEVARATFDAATSTPAHIRDWLAQWPWYASASAGVTSSSSTTVCGATGNHELNTWSDSPAGQAVTSLLRVQTVPEHLPDRAEFSIIAGETWLHSDKFVSATAALQCTDRADRYSSLMLHGRRLNGSVAQSAAFAPSAPATIIGQLVQQFGPEYARTSFVASDDPLCVNTGPETIVPLDFLSYNGSSGASAELANPLLVLVGARDGFDYHRNGTRAKITCPAQSSAAEKRRVIFGWNLAPGKTSLTRADLYSPYEVALQCPPLAPTPDQGVTLGPGGIVRQPFLFTEREIFSIGTLSDQTLALHEPFVALGLLDKSLVHPVLDSSLCTDPRSAAPFVYGSDTYAAVACHNARRIRIFKTSKVVLREDAENSTLTSGGLIRSEAQSRMGLASLKRLSTDGGTALPLSEQIISFLAVVWVFVPAAAAKPVVEIGLLNSQSLAADGILLYSNHTHLYMVQRSNAESETLGFSTFLGSGHTRPENQWVRVSFSPTRAIVQAANGFTLGVISVAGAVSATVFSHFSIGGSGAYFVDELRVSDGGDVMGKQIDMGELRPSVPIYQGLVGSQQLVVHNWGAGPALLYADTDSAATASMVMRVNFPSKVGELLQPSNSQQHPFSNLDSTTITVNLNNPAAIVASDLNGDNVSDVLWGHSGGGTAGSHILAWSKHSGQTPSDVRGLGTLVPLISIEPAHCSGKIVSLAAGRIDEGNVVDVLVACESQLLFYYNFTTKHPGSQATTTQIGLFHHSTADLNTCTCDTTTWQACCRARNAVFAHKLALASTRFATLCHMSTAGAGRGVPVVAHGSKISWFALQHSSSFQETVVHTDTDTSVHYNHLACSDMDGDGWVDIVASGNKHMKVFRNPGVEGVSWQEGILASGDESGKGFLAAVAFNFDGQPERPGAGKGNVLRELIKIQLPTDVSTTPIPTTDGAASVQQQLVDAIDAMTASTDKLYLTDLLFALDRPDLAICGHQLSPNSMRLTLRQWSDPLAPPTWSAFKVLYSHTTIPNCHVHGRYIHGACAQHTWSTQTVWSASSFSTPFTWKASLAGSLNPMEPTPPNLGTVLHPQGAVSASAIDIQPGSSHAACLTYRCKLKRTSSDNSCSGDEWCSVATGQSGCENAFSASSFSVLHSCASSDCCTKLLSDASSCNAGGQGASQTCSSSCATSVPVCSTRSSTPPFSAIPHPDGIPCVHWSCCPYANTVECTSRPSAAAMCSASVPVESVLQLRVSDTQILSQSLLNSLSDPTNFPFMVPVRAVLEVTTPSAVTYSDLAVSFEVFANPSEAARTPILNRAVLQTLDSRGIARDVTFAIVEEMGHRFTIVRNFSQPLAVLEVQHHAQAVSPSRVRRLVVSQQPCATMTAGVAPTGSCVPTVHLLDKHNSVITEGPSATSVVIASAVGYAPALQEGLEVHDATAHAIAGIARFSALRIPKVHGNVTLHFALADSVLSLNELTAESTQFAVIPGAPAGVVFARQPGPGTPSSPLTVVEPSTVTVTVRDDGDGGTVRFLLSAPSVSEGASFLTLTVTRENGNSGSVIVRYRQVGGTASEGADFEFTDELRMLSFTDGDESGTTTFTIRILNDNVFEYPDETVALRLVDSVGGIIISPNATAVVTIVDDGDAGRPAFLASSFHMAESAATPPVNGTLLVTVSRLGGLSSRVQVRYATATPGLGVGVATPGVDFVPTSGFLVFENLQPTRAISLQALDDDEFELPDEFFNIVLSEPQYIPNGGASSTTIPQFVLGSPSQSRVNVTDDGDAGFAGFVSLTQDVLEQNTIVNIPIVRGGRASATTTLLIQYGVSGVGSSAPPACTPLSDPATLASLPGVSGNIQIPIQDDGAFLVRCRPMPLRDCSHPCLSLELVTLAQSPQFPYPKVRVCMCAVYVEVPLPLDGCLSLASKHYCSVPSSLPVLPQGAAACSGPRLHQITVVDDGDAGTFAFSQPFFTFSEAAAQSAFVAVTRMGDHASGKIAVRFSAENGTARENEDFIDPIKLAGAEQIFNDSQRLAVFQVPIINDAAFEFPNEWFLLHIEQLLYATGPTLRELVPTLQIGSARTANLTIEDDGDAGTVGFVTTSFSIKEAGNVLQSITVTRRGASSAAVTLDYSTESGTALSGVDYKPSVGTIVFPDGAATGVLTVNTFDDDDFEYPDEFFLVRIFSYRYNGMEIPELVIGGLNTSRIVIQDDGDGGTFSFFPASYAVPEVLEKVTLATVTVTRLSGSSGSFSLKVDTAMGSARSNLEPACADTRAGSGLSSTELAINTLATGSEEVKANSSSSRAVLSSFSGLLGTGVIGGEFSTSDVLGIDDACRLGAGATDYRTLSSRRLHFEEGITARTFTLQVFDDLRFEYPDEEFQVQISDVRYGSQSVPLVLAPAPTATIAILDNGDAGNFAFYPVQYEQVEGDGVHIVLTVSRQSGSVANISVEYTTVPSTATHSYRSADSLTSDLDFEAGSGLLTFGPAPSISTITISLRDDSLFEIPDEEFFVRLTRVRYFGSSLGNYTLTEMSRQAIVTIKDDGDGGTLGFSPATYRVPEVHDAHQTKYTVTVTRVSGNSQELTVDFETQSVTATARSDFVYSRGTLTFPDGVVLQTIEVGILDDNSFEHPDEQFEIRLENITCQGIREYYSLSFTENDTATVTIMDDGDAGTLSFHVDEYRAPEGGETPQGRFKATFVTLTLTRTGRDRPSAEVSARVTILARTAQVASQPACVHPTGAPSQFYAQPSNGDLPWLTEVSGIPTPLPSSNKSEFVSPPTFSNNIAADATTCNADDAASGDVLALLSHYVVFADGAASATFVVTVLDDDIFEHPDETFVVDVSDIQYRGQPKYSLRFSDPTVATVTIVDDGDAGSFQLSTPLMSIKEHESGQSQGTMTITRLGRKSQAVRLQVETRNATANAGVDYVHLNFSMLFLDKQTRATVRLTVIDDVLFEEPDEVFSLNLTRIAYGDNTIPEVRFHNHQSAVIRVVDDGDAGTLQWSLTTLGLPEGRGQNTSVGLTVTRTRRSSGNISIDFALVPGTATPNVDFLSTAGTLVFLDGQVASTIALFVLDDSLFEHPDETVLLSLSNFKYLGPTTPVASKRVIGLNSTSTVVIRDDGDAGSFSFHVSQYVAREGFGNDTLLTMTVTRTEGKSGQVSVGFQMTEGTAQASSCDQLGSSEKTFINTTGHTTAAPIGYSTSFVPPASSCKAAILSSNKDFVRFEGAHEGAVVFVDLQTVATFTVRVLDDDMFEYPDEVFIVNLSRIWYVATGNEQVEKYTFRILDPASASVTITDDGDLGTLTFDETADYRPLEPTAQVQLDYPVLRRHRVPGHDGLPSGALLTVQASTASGTASSAGTCVSKGTHDFIGSSTTLSFTSGVQHTTFPVQLCPDADFEFPDEVFTVFLHTLRYQVTIEVVTSPLYPLQIVNVTILDDGDAGVISFMPRHYSFLESEGGQRSMTRTLTLSRSATSGSFTLQYETVSGTAQPDSDFMPTTGEIALPHGEHGAAPTIVILDDLSFEETETFAVAITGITYNSQPSASLGINATGRVATISITDDGDVGTLSFCGAQFSTPDPDCGRLYWCLPTSVCGMEVKTCGQATEPPTLACSLLPAEAGGRYVEVREDAGRFRIDFVRGSLSGHDGQVAIQYYTEDFAAEGKFLPILLEEERILQFSSGVPNEVRSFFVTIIDDSVVTDNKVFLIRVTHAPGSPNAGLKAFPLGVPFASGALAVYINDDDLPDIVFCKIATGCVDFALKTVDTENLLTSISAVTSGSTLSTVFYVVLKTNPGSASVFVTLRANLDLVLSRTGLSFSSNEETLVFTSANFNVPQAVYIRAPVSSAQSSTSTSGIGIDVDSPDPVFAKATITWSRDTIPSATTCQLPFKRLCIAVPIIDISNSIQGTLRLNNLDGSLSPAQIVNEAAFSQRMIQEIAASLGISPQRIKVTGIRKGSIIVDFEIDAGGSGDQAQDDDELDAVRKLLQQQLRDPASALMSTPIGELIRHGHAESTDGSREVGCAMPACMPSHSQRLSPGAQHQPPDCVTDQSLAVRE